MKNLLPSIKKIFRRCCSILLMMLSSFSILLACDCGGFTVNDVIDNGDGTYTIDVTVVVAGNDCPAGTFGSTRQFSFGTDVPMVSVTPTSLTSLNGTTINSNIAGNQVTYGPGGGPFVNTVTDPTQTFNFSVVVTGRPTSWTGSGLEGSCTYSGVLPCPLPGLVIVSGDQTICEGQSVTLVVSSANMQPIIWSTGETGSSITVMPTVTTTYTATITNDCGSADVTMTVTVDPLPQIIPPPDLTICEGEPFLVDIGGTFANTIVWTPFGQTGAVLSDNPIVTTTYTAFVSNDCGSLNVSFTVTVDPLPVLDVFPGDITICAGDEAALSAVVQNETTFLWLPNNVTTTDLSDFPTNTTTYTAFASNFCGQISEDITVTVNEGPELVFISPDITICEGQTTDLEVLFDLEDGFNWNPPNSSDSRVSVTPGSTTTYNVSAFNGCGIIDTSVTVTVSPSLTSALSLSACPGESAPYNGTTVPVGTSQDFSFTTPDGCDSTVTVTVDERPTFTGSETVQACSGSDGIYDGTSLPIGTIQDFTFTASNGCDSVVTVEVIEVLAFTSTETLSACPGETAPYDGTNVPAGTSQDFSFVATNGCDSTVTVTVNERSTFTDSETLQACSGTDATYDGTTLPIGTIQDFTFTASNGCDSVVTVEVIEVLAFTSTETLSACPGETAPYNGTNIPAGTSQDFSFVATNGCDSTVTVTVDERPTFTDSETLQACSGSDAFYDGTSLPIGTIRDFTFTAANGCDSVVTVEVIEVLAFTSTETLSACPGETAPYNGTSVPAGTSQDFSFVASNGCDSTVTVTVNERPTFTGSETLEACTGTDAIYDGSPLPIGTIRDFTFTAANGCDSVVTVEVIEVLAFTSTETLSACPGETAPYNGTSVPAGTSQDFSFVAANGCDSTVTVTVDERTAFTDSETLQACTGTDAFYDGTPLPIGTIRDFTFTAANGCDSVVSVEVIEILAFTSTETLSACPGETAPYNGTNVPAGTSQDFSFVAANGCDSTVTVTVDERPTFTGSETLEACTGTDAFYDGTPLPVGTIRDFTFAAANGCDSVVTVEVIELSIFTSTETLSACPGETAPYNGTNIPAGSSQDFSFVASNGCDSTVTVTVDERLTFTGSETLETCTGIDAIYNGTSLPIGTIQDFTFTASNGCDSVITVEVIEVFAITASEDFSVCPGESIPYDGTDVLAGTSQDFVFTASNGCDSTVTVSVDELSTFTSNETLEACTGTNANYDGTTLPIGIIQDFVFTAFNGCDSTVTVEVVELLTFTSTEDLTACPGTTVSYNGADVLAGTSQDFVLTAVNGCDSTVTVNVAELATFTDSETLQACRGTDAIYNGTPLPVGTIRDFTFTAANGCDSVVTVEVIEVQAFTSTENLLACPGGSAPYNGSLVPTGTSQDFTFTATNGCDSIVTVMVDELPTFASRDTLQTCPGRLVSFQGQDLAAGSSTDFTFPAQNGCDSVVTFFVQQVDNITNSIRLTACQGDSAPFDGVDILAGESRDFNYVAANGCDSIVTVTVDELLPTTASETLRTCQGTTIPYDGVDLSIGDVQDFTFTGNNGCDSVVTVTVEGIDNFNITENFEACAGTSITFDGLDVLAGTSQDFNYTSISGCDSIITVVVAELENFSSEQTLQTCQGQIVTYEGQTLAIGSVTDFTLTAINGCDSVVTVTVEGVDVYTELKELESCASEMVSYAGVDLSPGDTQDFPLIATNGCDSIVTVVVLELPEYDEQLVINTCEGVGATYNGQQLDPFSITPFMFSSIDGCDSIVTVLVESSVPQSSFEVAEFLCAGDSLLVGNDFYFSSQSIQDTLTAFNGCDSILTVNLTVNEPITTEVESDDSCEEEATGSVAVTVSGGTTPYNYSWNNGFSSAAVQDDLPAGIYQLTIIDVLGCTTTADAEVLTTTIEFGLTDEDPRCADTEDGIILIDPAEPTWRFSIDGSPFIAQSVFNNLPAGQYSIRVQDEAGCIYTRNVQLDQPPVVAVSLPKDTIIDLGNDYVITANVTGTPPLDFSWNVDSCRTCDQIRVSPLENNIYELLVTDSNGCTDIDEMAINIRNDDRVYIPNVFSPNDDGFNDIFTVYADESVTSIKTFNVYSRWGELVHSASGFNPGDESNGWNGELRGEEMDPAVFVYYVVVEYIDGREKLFEGDVTLAK